MYCYKCGKEIDDEAVVCPHCGCATKNFSQQGGTWSRTKTSDENVSGKSRLVALLLCIFLGFIGVHRYYIGKIGTGILWTFTAGCFYIGWIIDIVFIACGKMTDKDGNVILSWDGNSTQRDVSTPLHSSSDGSHCITTEEPWEKKNSIKNSRFYGMLRIVLGLVYAIYGASQIFYSISSGPTFVLIGIAVAVWGIIDRKKNRKKDE